MVCMCEEWFGCVGMVWMCESLFVWECFEVGHFHVVHDAPVHCVRMYLYVWDGLYV